MSSPGSSSLSSSAAGRISSSLLRSEPTRDPLDHRQLALGPESLDVARGHRGVVDDHAGGLHARPAGAGGDVVDGGSGGARERRDVVEQRGQAGAHRRPPRLGVLGRVTAGSVWRLGLPVMQGRPAFVTPMKAVLTAERPAGPEWVFERKLDGIRCLAVKDGGRTRLYSRNELSLNDRYAPLAAALDDDPADGFVVDGEAVAFVGGRDRFGGGEGGELFLYVFDVLFADGRDVRSLPLEERREVLAGVLSWRDPLRMTEQLTGDGADLLADACARRLGGADRQAHRHAVRLHALARLAQAQVHARAGARDRRLHRAARLAHGPRRAARRPLRRRPLALRRQGGDGLHARDAARAVRAARPARARDVARSSPRRAFRAPRPGSSPSSWPRSRSWNGPPTAACAIPRSSACASTSPRARSCANGHGEPPAQPPCSPTTCCVATLRRFQRLTVAMSSTSAPSCVSSKCSAAASQIVVGHLIGAVGEARHAPR